MAKVISTQSYIPTEIGSVLFYSFVVVQVKRFASLSLSLFLTYRNYLFTGLTFVFNPDKLYPSGSVLEQIKSGEMHDID